MFTPFPGHAQPMCVDEPTHPMMSTAVSAQNWGSERYRLTSVERAGREQRKSLKSRVAQGVRRPAMLT